MATSNDRAEALRRLAELGAAGAVADADTSVTVTRSDREVYAGGDVRRLLVNAVHLRYVRGDVAHYPEAGPGDVVTLTQADADRLDKLGATVDPDVDDEDLEAQLSSGEVTDDQLRAMGAEALVAHVGQHPEDKARVRALEEERGDKARKTVLAATEDTEE